jgi:small-conductance mechanosensitive channel
VNYTRDGLRRLSFTVGIDYADDVDRARALLLDAIAATGMTLGEPGPGVLISAFQPNYVELRIYYWIDTMDPPQSVTPVASLLMERCRRVLREGGFTLSSEVTTAIAIAGDPALNVRIEAAGGAA